MFKEYEKNHLQSETFVDKHVLLDRALDCDFHRAVKRDMTYAFLSHLAEKVRFTETNDPSMCALKVRADVYVFSPEEIACIVRDTKKELEKAQEAIVSLFILNQKTKGDYLMLNDEIASKARLIKGVIDTKDNTIKELTEQLVLQRARADHNEMVSVVYEDDKAKLRGKIEELVRMNDNQSGYIRDLRQEKEGIERLFVNNIMMCPQPPMYFLDSTRQDLSGRIVELEKARKEKEVRANARIGELEAGLRDAETACKAAVSAIWKARHKK